MNIKTPLAAVILAAGRSTRMDMQPKAALSLAGKPMGRWVLEAVKSMEPEKILVVVGHEAERVKEAFGEGCTFILQEPQLGTAHAVLACEEALRGFEGNLLLVNADHPLLSSDDLQRLLAHHRRSKAAATLLTWQSKGESSYGRIQRNEKGEILGIIEGRDATPGQLAISEVNLSMYCFAAPMIFHILRCIRPDNVQREYYLTDAIGFLVRQGKIVEGVEAESPETGFGINTHEEFARAEAFLLRGTPLE
jgi:bifunctional N-acetylglucosamine-1-phosphate-uridyltransferase/glucosamine-1-phosphate-acetyltransferase GlmU-like protein